MHITRSHSLGQEYYSTNLRRWNFFFFNKKDWWAGETEFTEVMELSDEVIKFVHALQIEN